VVTTAAGIQMLERLSFEHRDIIALCRQPQSLAEVAAKLRLHLNVVRVLAEDLQTSGLLSVYMPSTEAARDVSVLRRVIDGLRTIPDSRGTLRDTN
jgi:predicted ArsR family transcriptional regulator